MNIQAAPDGQIAHATANPTLCDARIAIVDDEPINIKVARKYLQGVGYHQFVTTTDSTTAVSMIAGESPDVVLLDIMMPLVSGIDILRAVRADSRLCHIPILILTASTDAQTKLMALESGATDFLAKPVDPNELVPRIRNALIVKAHHDHLARYSEQLEEQVRARTRELEASRLEVIHCLARAGEFRDDATGEHVLRVSRYARIIALELGLSLTDCANIELAAQLHDVGKIGLPDAILLKRGKLTDDEYAVVQRHCEIGSRIVRPNIEDVLSRQGAITGDILEIAARIALTHHERWDGAGYPRGLAGESIPIEGRIVAVADVFDALRSARSYKSAMSPDEAVAKMNQSRGTHFDPRILDAMLRRLPDMIAVVQKPVEVTASPAAA